VDLRTPDGPPAASNPRGCLGKLVASIDYQIGRPNCGSAKPSPCSEESETSNSRTSLGSGIAF
ncbi:hypothetical protein, partial [Bradyrhizobium canariense]|uniref:hypothetical protein n=1 Tax=Bradyrhizobium canariense TaxID=255045 RepID=UPI001A7E0E86